MDHPLKKTVRPHSLPHHSVLHGTRGAPWAATRHSKGQFGSWSERSLNHGRSVLYLDEMPIIQPTPPTLVERTVESIISLVDYLSEKWGKVLLAGSECVTFSISPTSNWRKTLNLLLAFGIIFECTIIPLRSVWGFDWNYMPLWLFLDYFMDTVYLVDIWMNFITAYTEDGTGKMITNRRLIAKRYLRSGFFLHFLASLPFDFLALKYGIHSLPWCRLNRILRVIQLSSLFSALEKGFGSPIIRVIRLFFVMILFAHWFGCVWFLIAKLEGYAENTWARVAHLEDQDTFTQYITSAYWALVVMTTVGFGDIVPVSNIEKGFTIMTMIAGVTIYATIFGNMATLITQLDASAARYREKLDNLHEYMRYRCLPQYLRDRVLSYHEVIWSRHKGIDESTILNELPSSLRSEIALFLNRELVENVPLFKGTNEPGFINSLVVMLKPQVALAGDYIIRHGEIGREMYFLSRGEVEVVSGDGKTIFARLKEGSYFGEIALLFAARRIASIRALGYCELLLLTKDDFDSVLTFFPSFADAMRDIARQKIEEERKKREADKNAHQGENKASGSETNGEQKKGQYLTADATSGNRRSARAENRPKSARQGRETEAEKSVNTRKRSTYNTTPKSSPGKGPIKNSSPKSCKSEEANKVTSPVRVPIVRVGDDSSPSRDGKDKKEPTIKIKPMNLQDIHKEFNVVKGHKQNIRKSPRISSTTNTEDSSQHQSDSSDLDRYCSSTVLRTEHHKKSHTRQNHNTRKNHIHRGKEETPIEDLTISSDDEVAPIPCYKKVPSPSKASLESTNQLEIIKAPSISDQIYYSDASSVISEPPTELVPENSFTNIQDLTQAYGEHHKRTRRLPNIYIEDCSVVFEAKSEALGTDNSKEYTKPNAETQGEVVICTAENEQMSGHSDMMPNKSNELGLTSQENEMRPTISPDNFDNTKLRCVASTFTNEPDGSNSLVGSSEVRIGLKCNECELHRVDNLTNQVSPHTEHSNEIYNVTPYLDPNTDEVDEGGIAHISEIPIHEANTVDTTQGSDNIQEVGCQADDEPPRESNSEQLECPIEGHENDIPIIYDEMEHTQPDAEHEINLDERIHSSEMLENKTQLIITTHEVNFGQEIHNRPDDEPPRESNSEQLECPIEGHENDIPIISGETEHTHPVTEEDNNIHEENIDLDKNLVSDHAEIGESHPLVDRLTDTKQLTEFQETDSDFDNLNEEGEDEMGVESTDLTQPNSENTGVSHQTAEVNIEDFESYQSTSEETRASVSQLMIQIFPNEDRQVDCINHPILQQDHQDEDSRGETAMDTGCNHNEQAHVETESGTKPGGVEDSSEGNGIDSEIAVHEGVDAWSIENEATGEGKVGLEADDYSLDKYIAEITGVCNQNGIGCESSHESDDNQEATHEPE